MAALLLLSLLLLLDSRSPQAFAAVINGPDTGNTFVDWQRGLMVHSVAGSCYVAPVPTDRRNIEDKPNRLYATVPLSREQVLELNSALATDCPTDDSWWLSPQRPTLPTLADYLSTYSANTINAKKLNTRIRRSTGHRPSNTLMQRLHDISRRLADGTLTAAQVREGGGRVLLTNDPYPSPLFERSATDGHRFKHYRAFYDEIARNSKPQSDRSDAATSNTNSQRSDRNSNPQDNVLNSYSLRVRGNSRAGGQASEGVQGQGSESNRHSSPLQLQGAQQPGQYEIYGNSNNEPSNNGKRHVSNAGGNNRRQKPLRLHPSTGQNVQQQADDVDQSLHIPDSIIKDGQVFYRHDATADHENGDTEEEHVIEGGAGGAGGTLQNDLNRLEESSDSLIFSQAQGSTGNDGSFRAEAEGHGRYGESTHSAVDGNQNGASASSSAIRFDQQAMAHVQVNPSRHSPSSGIAPQVATQTPVAASEIEQMMRRNGYTGFAMATVKARKMNGNEKPLSSLGHILPGYSSAIYGHPVQDPIADDMEEEEKHDMVDSIVEQVYSPSEHGILIDHGGLDGGAGASHRESEFQQINDSDLLEGGAGIGDDQSVGLATYTQGVHGYPPGSESDYPDEYYDLDRYNYNPPLYFPEYESLGGAEIEGGTPGREGYSDTRDYLPSNLDTGIQFPIIEGDVSVPSLSNGNTMIVDNTLSSYFPLPLPQPKHDYSSVLQTQGNTREENIHSYNVSASEGEPHSVLDADTSTPNFQPGTPYDSQYLRHENSYGSDIGRPTESMEGSGDGYYPGSSYNPLDFPSSSGADDNARIEVMDVYSQPDDRTNSQNRFDVDSIPQSPQSNDDRNQYSVHSGQGHEDNLFVREDGSETQPAYNSLWEYERNQQKLEEEQGSGLPSEEFYNRADNVEPDNIEPTSVVSGRHDPRFTTSDGSIGRETSGRHDSQFTTSDGSIGRETPGRHDPQFTTSDGGIGRETFEDDGFDSDYDDSDNGYESSFETSSQSNSQSAQSIYTASHHYSFQHGSNERGIGSSTNTALVKPVIEIPDPVRPYNYYTPDELNPPSYQQRPTIAPFGSPLPSVQQPHHSIPSQPFSNQQHSVQPSASQGVERMQVISPGGPGSMQSLPSSDSSLSEVKVVMAEAPSPSEQMERMGKVIMAGEKIPGTTGYMVPPGFRGRLVLGNIALTSMSTAHMSPGGMATQLSNQVHGQLLPSRRNDNMQMRLSSSSSASSSGSGVSLSSSSSSRATGGGSLSAMSESSSNGIGGRNQYTAPNNQPVYSYHQTFNANPMENFQHPNAIVGPYMPNMGQQDNNPGMRSKSWSSWKTTSWRSSKGNGNMGPQARDPASSGQYVSQSSAMPGASECGYWSMNCRMIQSPFQQSEICRPAHVILPCCC